MKGKRALAFLLAAALLAALAGPALAAGGEVTLSTPQDLAAFARNCTLDSWSRGRTVRLLADLDLSGADFAPIPTFGGSFYGNGHTISGLKLTEAGSRQGLFRTLQPGGVIQDLRVEGTVTPTGSRELVGGVVGVNRGTLQNCTFTGRVEGGASVGGIAGLNETEGRLVNCVFSGTVLGSRYAGGICGRSLGTISYCTNKGQVNTQEVKTSQSLADLDVTAPLEQLTATGQTAAEGHTDVGGVVGWSSGVVQRCVNEGAVGYPHVGYNVGGIAGRQTGYLWGCENIGPVLGRKDVGGLVGQAEPEVSVTIDRGALGGLGAELDSLNAMIQSALGDVDEQTAVFSQRLSAMGEGVTAAREHSQVLAEGVDEMVEGNVQALNLLSANVTSALTRAEEAMDELSGAAQSFADFSRELSAAMESMRDASESGAALYEELQPAITSVGTATAALETSTVQVTSAMEHLEKGVVIYDKDVCDKALLDLASGTTGFGRNLRDLGIALSSMGEAMGGVHLQLTGDLAGDLKQLEQSLGPVRISMMELGEALRLMGVDINIIGLALWNLHDETDIFPEELKAGVVELEGAITSVGDAIHAVSLALKAFREASDEVDALSEDLSEVFSHFSAAAGHAGDAGDGLSRGFSGLGEAMKPLTDGGPVEFTPLSSEARDSVDDLYEALGTVSDELSALNRETVGATGALTADLGAISDQMNTVFGLLLSALFDIQDGTGALIQVQDVSDEELDAIRQGKTADGVNRGDVEGDRDVGGIVGAMAIEYDLDPEDDASGSRFSYNAIYETRAVLQNCVNYGAVTAKKDCAGGVVGRMDLGTVIGCQDYGPVTSTGGNYVGGVAGLASSTLRSSYARVRLSGKNYVGGIAGSAVTLRDCTAVASVAAGQEYLGAIAGWADPEAGTVTGNRFLDTGLGAIDSVSYQGAAEPVSFRELSRLEGLPQALMEFTLTLVCEGETQEVYPIEYGQDLTALDLPDPVEREGYYGRWPDLPAFAEGDVVAEGVYTPWVTLLPSNLREGPLARVIADGQFTRAASLRLERVELDLPRGAEEAFALELEGTGLPDDGEVAIRVLAGEDQVVYRYEAGSWRKAECTRRGRYVCLTVPVRGTVLAVAQGRQIKLLPILLGALGAAVVVGAVVIAAVVRRRRRGGPPKGDPSPEEETSSQEETQPEETAAT